jgi:NADPH-dependent 2,4-dienoyl-CoA reductase/sulfur reductase-like enzyme
MHIVIIGNGPAGEKAAGIIQKEKPEYRITIITEESCPFYLRPGLVNYIAGELKEHAFCTKDISKYQDRNIELLLNSRVTKLNPAKQELEFIHTQSNEAQFPLHYDQLLIATGANYFIAPQLLPFRQYLYTVHSIDDANQLIESSKTAKTAVVMGSSLLGAELVRALYQLGISVTYLTRKETFWPRTLFHTRAEQVASVLREHGIDLVYGEDIRNVTVYADKLVGVITSKKRELDCDLVGIATDLVPSVDFLKDSGLKIFRGVVVDPQMRTNLPNIYAAGDIAQVYYPKHKMHQVHYSWINASEQGEIAGYNMAGIPRTFREEYATDEIEMYGLNILSRWIRKK